jgi:hypothetical protein
MKNQTKLDISPKMSRNLRNQHIFILSELTPQNQHIAEKISTDRTPHLGGILVKKKKHFKVHLCLLGEKEGAKSKKKRLFGFGL